jgi:ATP-dependent DNA helicase RecG
VDNRQEYIHAFAMVLEGMEFLRKTMPLGARFPKGEIFREDRFPVPLEALREILLNAVMHRDYSSASGYVAIAVFDDRIEISSYGRLPTGITVKQLSSEHRSYPVNPLIAGAFHRTGAVEIWGRGTNRVIAACKAHGAAPPVFHEQQGFVVVTFRAEMVAGIAPLQVTQHVSPQVEAQEAQVEAQEAQVSAQVGEEVGEQVTGEVTREVTREVAGEVTGEVRKLLGLCRGSMTRTELQAALSLRGEENFRKLYLVPALQAGLIEMTVPDKPRSRLQRYRATEAGLAMLRRKYKINHRDTERTEER